MKLAEALHLRADLQKRMNQLQQRLLNNAKVQEGDEPAENSDYLISELKKCSKSFENLVAQINLTNSQPVCDGCTLTELIAKKDAATLYLNQMRTFLNAASNKVDRYSNKEILVKSTVDVKALQAELDNEAKALRELDMKIQSLNWTIDLMEKSEGAL